jgi:hypothetical protein
MMVAPDRVEQTTREGVGVSIGGERSLSRIAVFSGIRRQFEARTRPVTRLERLVELWQKKWPLWLVLTAFFFFGVLLIVVPSIHHVEADFGISRDIGIAFLTASLLGISVDIFLKRGIAKDAFEGAVGYVLPVEIKEFVHSIAGIDWFAEEFSLSVDLAIIDKEKDVIKATIKVRKLMRNITNLPQPIKSFIWVDDWERDQHKSEIVECQIRNEARGVLETLDHTSIKKINSTLYGSTKEIRVGPGETVELLATGIEYKRFNDDLHYALGYAAKWPEINVSRLPGFEVGCGISTEVIQESHPHLIRVRLRGFYFPWQRMMVRWYPKNGGGATSIEGASANS